MLAIRMQRTGRKGHAMFRMVVQDARRTPTSGKVVARIGSYDPHAKTTTLDKEKASFYLEHGAQPSSRAAVLLKKEGVKLPDWVKQSTERERAVRNADKRRSTRPAEPAAGETTPAEKPADSEAPATADATETPAESNTEVAQSDATEVPEAETPAAEADAATEEEATEAKAPAADEADTQATKDTEMPAEKPTEK